MNSINFIFTEEQQLLIAEQFGIPKEELMEMEEWKISELLDRVIDEWCVARKHGML